jgi:hypothetical protein
MALAVHASTPVYVSTATSASSLTTASFTPPVGSLLVVLFSNADLAIGINKPTNTGGAVTWDASVAASELANSCGAAVWRGLVTTSAAMTVTATPTSISQTDWGFGVPVVTGQAATQNGATGVATSASGTPSVTTSALVGDNSLVLGAFANDFNGTIGTPGAGQSLTFNAHAFSFAASGSADWAQYLTGMNLAAGGTATLNDTAPTGVNFCAAAVEILAAGAVAPATVPFIPCRMPLGV